MDPFIGRRAFRAGDHASFFGRSGELRQLVALCMRGSPALLHGMSGVGKTSILGAGLVHALRREADVLAGSVIAASPFPQAALPDHNPFTLALLASWSPGTSRTSLSSTSVTDFLRVRAAANGWSHKPLIAVVDQLEELFIHPRRQQHRHEFLDDIATAARVVPAVTFVLALRSEYLADLAPYRPQLRLGPDVELRLGLLSRAAALEAVRGPAAAAGLSFPPEVAEALVDDLIAAPGHGTTAAEHGANPTQLQVICSSLWQSTGNDSSVITVGPRSVREHNDAALSGYCSDVIDEVAAEHNMAAAELTKILASRLVTGHGQPRVVRGDKKIGITSSILRSLEARHLIRLVHNSGEPSYALANERLAPVVAALSRPAPRTAQPVIDAAAHLRTALAMQSAARQELAENHAWQALSVASASELKVKSDAYSFLGNLAFERDELALAEEYYLHAAQLSDQLQDQAAVARLLGAIGRLHAQQGRIEAAIEDLQSAVARLPGDLILQTELAKALRSAGQAQAAAAVFGTVLTIKPDFPDALAGRGEIQADRGNALAALDDLRLLRQVQPNLSTQPGLRSAYALALARVGMIRPALEEADAALASAGDNGLVYLRAACVVASAGRSPERAEALLRRAADAYSPAPTREQLNEARRFLAATSEQHPAASEPSLPAVG